MSWTVGEVAEAAGVTVRTLHHWDEVGLLRPSGRSPAGYRLYEAADLSRLQQVLGYRELGFGLEQVARFLDDPDVDLITALRRQHTLLVDKAERLLTVAAAVGRAVEGRRMGIELTPAELREVFGDDDPTVHAEEAEQRWGDTDAYRESHRRTSTYGVQDWTQIRREASEIEGRFAQALRAGLPADGPVAAGLVQEHRAHISRWFYDCSPQMQRGLAEMYVADARFTRHYDDQAPGLARFVHDAVQAATAPADGQP